MREVHPRHNIVESARLDFKAFWIKWRNKNGLTSAEELEIVTESLHWQLASLVACERRLEEAK